jgi:hypothetical protein
MKTKSKSLDLPRYESGKKYPSSRSAGYLELKHDKVLLVGVNKDQAEALFAGNSNLKVTTADPSDVPDEALLTAFTGRPLDKEEKEIAMRIGIVLVEGPGAASLQNNFASIYSQFRNSTMAMVLIDWE